MDQANTTEEVEYWVPDLSEKQGELFNTAISEDAEAVHPDFPTALLVSGARRTGKTLGVCHRVCRHLWDTPGARVALLSKTIRSMTDGGIWMDLLEIVIPEWQAAGIGFEFVTKDSKGVPGPKTDNVTRTHYFRVKNRWGGYSELRLLSLEHDQHVMKKLKNTRYSMIWFSELSLFKDAKVFYNSMQALRMVHLQPWQHLWIADTNPAVEGHEHWAYKLWYKRKGNVKEDEEYLHSLKLIEIQLEDNPYLTETQIKFQKSLYQDDPGEFDREVLGKWTAGHGNQGKHLADLYHPAIHVAGEPNEQIEIHPQTDVLLCGWDLGTVNHAAVILEKRLFMFGEVEMSVWYVIDCLQYVGERVNITDFTLEFLEKMDAVQRKVGRVIQFQHWSDDSAMNVWRGSGAAYDYLEVQVASKGRINLNGVHKPDGSVRTRVKLMRRLFSENRIFISGMCEDFKAMVIGVSQGSKANEFVANNQYKHMFDATTYPILMESAFELDLQINRQPTVSESGGVASI